MTRSIYLQYTCLKNIVHGTVSWPVEKEGEGTITVEKEKTKAIIYRWHVYACRKLKKSTKIITKIASVYNNAGKQKVNI